MKSTTTSKLLATSFAMTLLATLHPQLSTFAQGPLVPPGPPAATMKTLAQIEPRTPIDATHTPGNAGALFIISQPGSYYLTTNITGAADKNGITIAASGVTLDLMGFEMAGVASSSVGVFVSGDRANIAIRNGTVRSWGGDGVGAVSANNGQYQDLRLSANGSMGLSCGPNSTVVNCTAQSNTGDGILAGLGNAISGCAAQANNGNGISAGDGSRISDCSAVTNTLHGILAGNGSIVNGCTAQINQQHGISVGAGSTVSGCSAFFNQQNGFILSDGSTVKDCTARSNGQHGILTGYDCTVTSCTARRNESSGIVTSTGNTVSECTLAFNGGHGISVETDCQVRHNNCRGNGRTVSNGTGIYVIGGGNRIDDNNVTGNDYGIQCLNTGNIVIRNTARANTTQSYTIVAYNAVGSIFGIGGSSFSISEPWANFIYY